MWHYVVWTILQAMYLIHSSRNHLLVISQLLFLLLTLFALFESSLQMICWNLITVVLVASNVLADAGGQDSKSKSFFAFGGSVRWHNSNVSVKDFVSQLRVFIYSLPDETLRQVAHVLPNGAYSVVVSDSGRYRIRLFAPQGWNFLPAEGFEVDLNENVQNDQMNYVFDLTGFDVSGQVVTTGMTTGPPGLIVSIISDGIVFSQSKTTANGSFTISSIPPGKYNVTVGDSTSDSGASNVRASSSITISTSSLKLVDPLVLQVLLWEVNMCLCRVIHCVR